MANVDPDLADAQAHALFHLLAHELSDLGGFGRHVHV
jgi:hypothetical protein